MSQYFVHREKTSEMKITTVVKMKRVTTTRTQHLFVATPAPPTVSPWAPSSTPPPSSRNGDLFNIMKIFLNYSYYLGWCPFQIVDSFKDPQKSRGNSPRYRGQSWLPQKIVCCVSFSLSLFWTALDIRKNFPHDDYIRSPSAYFDFVLSLAQGSVKILTFKSLWKGRSTFVKLANFLETCPSQLRPPSKLGRSLKFADVLLTPNCIRVYLFLNWIVFWIGIVSGGLEDRPDVSSETTKLPYVIEAATKEAMLFEGDGKIQWNSTSGPSNLAPADYILITVGTIGYIQWDMMAFLTDSLSIICAATLWTTTFYFSQNLQEAIMAQGTRGEDPHQAWYRVKGHYEALVNISDTINKIIGRNISLSIIEAIVYYSTRFEHAFSHVRANLNWTNLIQLGWFFFGTSCMLTFLGDACHQTKLLKKWLKKKENREVICPREQQQLLDELNNNEGVGIKAGGIFTITYSLVANLVGVTVTYFIICIQR